MNRYPILLIPVLLFSGCVLAAPELLSPVSGETFSVSRPLVEWSPVKEAPPMVVEFRSKQDETVRYTSPAGDSRFVPSNPLPAGDWSVRIRPKGPFWSGGWSRRVFFSVKPGIPQLTDPAPDTRALYGEPVTCRWTPVAGNRMTYTVEWGRPDAAGVYQTEGQSSSLTGMETVLESLPPGQWEIRVRGDAPWGDSTEWSSVSTVIVATLLPWPVSGIKPELDVPLAWFQTVKRDLPERLENFVVRRVYRRPGPAFTVSGYRWVEQTYTIQTARTRSFVPLYFSVSPTGEVRELVLPPPFEGTLMAEGPAADTVLSVSAADRRGNGVIAFYGTEKGEPELLGEFYPGFAEYGSSEAVTLKALSDNLRSGGASLPAERSGEAVWCTALTQSEDGTMIYAAGVIAKGKSFDITGQELPDERLFPGDFLVWHAVLERQYDELIVRESVIETPDPLLGRVTPLALLLRGDGEVWMALRAAGAAEVRFSRIDREADPLIHTGKAFWPDRWGPVRVAAAPGGEFLLWGERHLCPVVDWNEPKPFAVGVLALHGKEVVRDIRLVECIPLTNGEFVLYGFIDSEPETGEPGDPESIPVAVRVTIMGDIRFADGGPENRFGITLEKP